jgi:hypothetical protein
MPWANDHPRSPRYGRDHQATRARLMNELRRTGAGLCAERVCVMRTRVITPDMNLHLAHDPTGQRVLGLAHARCNTHEAAVRGNRLRYHPTHRHTRDRSRLTW